MRNALAALALGAVLAPTPAFAAESETDSMLEELSDPAVQEQIGAALEAMTEAVLAMPAAPLLRAAATVAGEDPESVDTEASVGDLAGPEAAEVPGQIAARLPQMMGAMAILAKAMEAMLPEFRAMGERIAEDMAKAGEDAAAEDHS